MKEMVYESLACYYLDLKINAYKPDLVSWDYANQRCLEHNLTLLIFGRRITRCFTPNNDS